MAAARDVVVSAVRQWLSQAPASKVLCIFINGPQGSGKTTLVRAVAEQLQTEGLRTASMSLDDFYLPFAEQIRLGETYKDNPLLQYRGNAGTHSVSLLVETLTKLKVAGHCSIETSPIRVPIFDKTRNNGRGDRLPEAEWAVVQPPINVVLLEGWMLGFRAIPAHLISDQRMIAVNQFLQDYQAVDSLADAFVQLVLPDLQLIYQYRLQAERQATKETGKQGLSAEQVHDFVDRFMPAYNQYLPNLLRDPPQRNNYLRIAFNVDRSVASVTTEP